MDRLAVAAEIKALLARASALVDQLAEEQSAPPRPAPPAQVVRGPLPFRDEGAFYDWLRGNKLLGPKITPSEYQGCNAILTACAEAGYGIADTSYSLATAYLETAHTMQPVKEANWLSDKAANAYFFRMSDINGARPAKARELGNIHPGDGAKFCGMGYPQMTGRNNYAKADAKLRARGILKAGESLIDQPTLAMRPDIAAAVMIYGMTEGWFTSKKLSDYLPRQGAAQLKDFISARRIINGTDRDDDVASYAVQFQTGLQAGGWRE